MGFYGNITNTSRTQFSFDRSYASRYEMDTNCATDGVYAGRYVLVEYDTDLSADIYNSSFYCVNYANSSEYNMYAQMDTSHGTEIFTGPLESTKIAPLNPSNGNGVKDGQIVRIPAGHKIFNINTETVYIRFSVYPNFTYTTKVNFDIFWDEFKSLDVGDIHFHIINGVLVPDGDLDLNKFESGIVFALPAGYVYSTSSSDEYWIANVTGDLVVWSKTTPDSATGSVMAGSAPTSNYLQNFNNDVKRYGTSRGYDSTVWQKMYSNNTEKYVMVAELNTVVPTFDICADAPSLVPISPHFDANSNNVYYLSLIHI